MIAKKKKTAHPRLKNKIAKKKKNKRKELMCMIIAHLYYIYIFCTGKMESEVESEVESSETLFTST